jgi:hypothetical protein
MKKKNSSNIKFLFLILPLGIISLIAFAEDYYHTIHLINGNFVQKLASTVDSIKVEGNNLNVYAGSQISYTTELVDVDSITFAKQQNEEQIMGRVGGITYWLLYGRSDGTWVYRGDQNGSFFESIFDGNLFTYDNNKYWNPNNKLAAYKPGAPVQDWWQLPCYFTIDMGRKASYSRLRYFMGARSPFFSATAMRKFSIWGTNDPKPVSEIGDGSQEDNLKYWTEWMEVGGTGAWRSDWEKIADCEVVLPSGMTTDEQAKARQGTAEDNAFIAAGFNFNIDPAKVDKPFRYLRFVVEESNHAYGGLITVSELQFWGRYAE